MGWPCWFVPTEDQELCFIWCYNYGAIVTPSTNLSWRTIISWSLASGISLANSTASHRSTSHQASSCHHYHLHKFSLVHTKGALRRQDFLITPWYSPWGFASKGEWVQFRVVFFHLIHCWQFWRSHIPTWVLMGWCQYICKGSVISKQWFSPVPCLIMIFG